MTRPSMGTEDAALDVILKVEACDVDKGAWRTPNSCPVAQAVSRLSGEGTLVSVGASRVYLTTPDGRTVRYLLLGKALDTIREYDETGIFPLGEIRLSAPRGVRKQGGRPPAKPIKKKGSRKGGKFAVARRLPFRHVARPDAPYVKAIS